MSTPTATKKVSVITLGCSKNTVDSERLLNLLNENGIELTKKTDDANIIIINTCGFIEAAKQESINTILSACEMKNEYNVEKVYVFGCLSERYKTELEKEIPEVDLFFGLEAYQDILESIKPDYKKELTGERFLSTPKHYAYLKISEGCNNGCSFCAIPLIRGKHRSTPIETLVEEATNLANKGVKELIIIGQDTTYYGLDIYKKRTISKLLEELSKIEGIEWIRLLYTYPSNFPIDLLETIKCNPKICSYIDIPLQHISNNVLSSMDRKISAEQTKALISLLRDSIPNIKIRTTFIVGYPTETEKDFKELLQFIEDTQFDRVGAFTYSVEEDTKSFKLGDPITEAEKQNRLNQLMELQQNISADLNEKRIGEILKVIVDSLEGNYFVCRSEFESPEVDGEILIEKSANLKIGEFYEAEIIDSNEYDLYAKIT